MNRGRCTALLLAALILSIPSVSAADGTIQILVDKKPMDLRQNKPAVLTDEVFVPARHFAEASGAKVDFDASTGTLTVTSAAGSGVLRLGSHQGWIRGTKVYFGDGPFMYDNQFYAPMLFFNEMFDQAWYWDPFYRQFKWTPIFPRFRGGLRPPMVIPGPGIHRPRPTTPQQPKPGSGCIVRPLPSETDPKIVVQIGTDSVTYPVTKDAAITRGSIGGQASDVPLGSLRPGDRVTFKRDSKGSITSLKAQFKMAKGKVKSSGSNTIVLETGDTLRVSSQTEILLPGNSTGDAADVKAGDVVIVSMSPDTRAVYVIQVQCENEAGEPIEGTGEPQVCLNTYGPLSVGDVLVVRLRANAGGSAWFTIPGVKANIRMKEIYAGTYEGRYEVQPGDTAIRQQVKVIFTQTDGQTFTRFTSRPMTLRTVSDYLPRITEPRQGQQIISPVVVRGEAQPGSLVRVIIEFRRIAQGILPLQGMTALQDVNADLNGDWVTPPLAAVMPFSDFEPNPEADFGVLQDWFQFVEEPPTVYTISAISIGPNGEERTAYKIQVFKQQVATVGGLPPLLVERNDVWPAGLK